VLYVQQKVGILAMLAIRQQLKTSLLFAFEADVPYVLQEVVNGDLFMSINACYVQRLMKLS
jgi:hypothetical protein